jgi:hypothetical protein
MFEGLRDDDDNDDDDNDNDNDDGKYLIAEPLYIHRRTSRYLSSPAPSLISRYSIQIEDTGTINSSNRACSKVRGRPIGPIRKKE